MLLTIKEVAKELKISLSMAYRLVSTGEIPCYEIGFCKRVDKEELHAYLKQSRSEKVKLPKGMKRYF